MPGNDVVPNRPARRFGSALRLVLFYLVVVAGTVGVYFIFYVDARVDQTVVRNFRALDSAAVRLTEIIANLHQVASNVPVGIDPKDLDEILAEFPASEPVVDATLGEERTRLANEIDRVQRELQRTRSKSSPANLAQQDGRAGAKSIAAQVAETETRLLQLNSRLDSIENRMLRPCKSSDSTLGAVQAIRSISGLYLTDFNAIPTAADLTFHPLLLRQSVVDGADANGSEEGTLAGDRAEVVVGDDARSQENRPALAGEEAKTEAESCAARLLRSLRTRLEFRALGDACTEDPRQPGIDTQIRRRLLVGTNGIEVEARDCGSFSERSPDLSDALPKGKHNVVQVLDDYGVGVRARLAGLVDTVATNVAPVFDQFLIADPAGTVIYSADGDGFRYQDVTGAPTARRARLDFASHVNVEELVRRAVVRRPSDLEEVIASTGLQSGQNPENDDYAGFGIHSRIENLQIADMTFQAFIHPFQVPGLDGLPERAATTDGGTAATLAPNVDPAAVLFMIGIVDSAALSNESVRLRVSLVTSALLILGLMVSLLPLLWLWTAGDRIMLKAWHPALFAATGLIAALLCTLFVLHLATGSIDDRALDRAIERVSHRIKDDFRAEFVARVWNLVDATSFMLSQGEAPARLRSPAGTLDPAADGGNANVTQSEIERAYYCRGPDGDASADETRVYPQFDLAFLLDSNGLQWQCLSYRLFDTRPIAVPFREYFQYPRDGRLWQSSVPRPPSGSVDGPTASVPVKFFLQRITSILDGTTETALSARPDDLCALRADACPRALPDVSAAAIIGRLHSLEDTILPPHFRYVVLENGSARTLFHTVGSHSLATNFIREVEVDDDLLALVDAGGSGFVDLSYYGASIRAYVQPLADGVPWTLVTYRGYELADTLNIITVSTTAAVMLSALVILFLLLSIASLLDRWARARFEAWDEIRDGTFSIELLPEAGRMPLLIAAVALMLLVVFVALLPNYAGVAATVSMLSLPAVLGVLVWRRARRCQRKASTSAAESVVDARPGYIRRQRGPVIGAGLIAIATLVVIPTIGMYTDVRARLGIGMSQYLYDLTRDAVVAKCERQTAFAARYKPPARAAVPKSAFRFGWTLRPGEATDNGELLPCRDYPDGRARLAMLGRGPDDNLQTGAQSRHGLLLAASGFSALGSDIVRRSLDTDPALTATHGASLGSLLDNMLGREDSPSRQSESRLGRLSLLMLSVLAGAGLIWIIVVSITDRVLGMRLRLAMLPVAALKTLPTGWRRLATRDRLRACVIHRSDRLWQAFLATMLGAGARTARRARWSGEAIVWETLHGVADSVPVVQTGAAENRDDDDSRTLYVVEGFERFIVDPQARDALLEALEKVSATKAGILIWTRILPGIWLADLNNQVAGDLASVSAELALTARWSQVFGPFDVRRLTHLPDRVAERFTEEIEAIRDVRIQPEVRRAMYREAMANPELVELAASAVQDICRHADPKDRNLRQLALQRFRASAAGHFHTIWAASSRSERLQLLALAKGGFANPTQTVTLSSLANRGLITTEGAVRLKSAAFKRFIVKDLHHDSLLQWRDAGHDNIWRSIWPPILLVAILATAFFVSSTPEALAPLVAILAAGFGIVPVIASMLRGMREIRIAPAAKE